MSNFDRDDFHREAQTMSETKKGNAMTLEQKGMPTFAEPYPLWLDKKLILTVIQIALGVASANGWLVVPEAVLYTIAGLVLGQTGIDGINATNAGRAFLSGAGQKIAGPTALLVVVLLPLFATSCFRDTGIVERAIAARSAEILSKVTVRDMAEGYWEEGSVTWKGPDNTVIVAFEADPSPPHTITVTDTIRPTEIPATAATQAN